MLLCRENLIVALVVSVALGVRLVGLGSFMTVDESNWMVRSSMFYDALFQNSDLGGTFQTTHPGATIMWLIGGGQFIQEQRLGIGVDTSTLRHFRLSATLPIVITSSLLIGLITWLLQKSPWSRAAVFVGLMLAVEPYVVGMSQVAHLDAILGLLMLASVVAFVVRQNNLRLRVLAGILAGMALGVKLLPALWLFVFFGLWVLRDALVAQKKLIEVFYLLIHRIGFVFGVAALTFYALWPVLWFQEDLGRSFAKDVPSVITQEHVAVAESEEPIAPTSFYLRTVLARLQPFSLLILLGVSVALVRDAWRKKVISDPLMFLAYAIGFLVLITFVAKKSDRYALPAILMFLVVIGFGVVSAWVHFIRVLSGVSTLSLYKEWVSRLAGCLVLTALIFQPILLAPHAIGYANPWFDFRSSTQKGWGEGLEQAAEWLNRHPLLENPASENNILTIASWYPSVMENYFDGRTMSLSSRHDPRVAFVVLYRNMFGRAQDDIASNVIDEYRKKEPVFVVTMNGQEQVWVYQQIDVRYFTKHVGEIIGETKIGQIVPVYTDNWDSIDIGMANFSGRNNTKDIILHVRESVEAIEDIRTVRINAADVLDSDWNRFAWNPIEGSAGRTYYVWLESPTSIPGNAITVKFLDQDIVPGSMVKNGVLQDGRDIAYRLD